MPYIANPLEGIPLVNTFITDQSLLGTTPATDDVLIIFDQSATALKQLTISELQSSITASVTGLTDTTITSIASGEVLKWNGSAWINQTLAEANILPVAGPTFTGVLTVGSAVISEADLEQIDDLTAGTVVASKALVVSSNKDIGTIRNLTIDGTFSDGNYTFDTSGNVTGLGNVTLTGELDAATLDISGNADIDGTLEADAITVDSVALATYIRDTVGTNMLSSNTESGIAVTYDTSNDNIDFALDAAQTVITSVYNASLKAGRDADNLIDFATTDNKIILRVEGVDEVELVQNALSPVTSDGVALGTGSLMWSDLFLAAGGVVNFNNGNMTITHTSAGLLTVAGGTLATAALTTSTIVASGIVKTDDATEATTTTDGSLQTDGGLSVVKDVVFGDDVKLLSDAAVLNFGADSDVNLTHVHNTGLLLNSTMQLQFNDSTQYISGTSGTVLSIAATDEIDLTATTIDINGAVALNGAITGATDITLSGELDAATGDFSGAVDIAGALTLSGADMDVSNQNLASIKTATFSLVDGGSASSGTIALNWANGMKQYVTLSGNVTITMAAPAGPCNVMLKIIHSGGARTVTWSDSVTPIMWPAGEAPTLADAAGTDIVAFFYDGTNFYGSASVKFS